MRKQFVSICSGILIAVMIGLSGIHSSVLAQPPTWSVNPSSFQHTMTLVSFLSVDGVILEDPQDKIGAFAGNQVRGVASPVFSASAGRFLAFLTIYGNTEGEELQFKIYDHSANKTVDVTRKINFVIDGQQGTVFQAFSLANPALSVSVEMIQFGFSEITPVESTLVEGGLRIMLEYDQTLDALTPEFELSDGAQLFIDRTPVVSGESIIDFTNPVTFSIRSEDESVLADYQVTVTLRESSDGPFSCTNVITANGDGKNDYWIVNESFRYKNFEFKIFDVNGNVFFRSTGYNNDWDGFYKGKPLDRGQYYYSVVNPASGEENKGTILVMH